MKLNIRGNSMIIVNDASGEKFTEYTDLFKKYFSTAAHHHQVSHELNKDSILIYSSFPRNIDCDNCSECEVIIHIPEKDFKINTVFFDRSSSSSPCGNIVKIFYGEYFLGYYCKKNNIFSVTDICHNSGNRKIIKYILDTMEEKGLLKILKQSKKEINLMLGADPELECIIDGKVISANGLIQICNHEKAFISHDGHTQPQREFRPDPAKTPQELVENIRDLIKISNFFGEDLGVLGNTFVLGGHIHFGGVGASNEIIQVLDYFLCPFNQFNSEIRRVSKYGKKGDYRFQPHGFEYRTPPPAWLLTPKLATMTLELSKKCVEIIASNNELIISNNEDLDEYKENLSSLGFSEKWIREFLEEIEWAKDHINEPLASLWDVEIPLKYKAKKIYRYNAPLSRIPSPRPTSSMRAEGSISMDINENESNDEEIF